MTLSTKHFPYRKTDTAVIPVSRREKNILSLTGREVRTLYNHAKNNRSGRARICAHLNKDDQVQEMFIAFTSGSYVQPHRHINKSESFHVIDGELDVFFFDNSGIIKKRISLGSASTSKPFYIRCDGDEWHSILIKSDYALIHEITSGPYSQELTISAPWAPSPENHVAVHDFLAKLQKNYA